MIYRFVTGATFVIIKKKLFFFYYIYFMHFDYIACLNEDQIFFRENKIKLIHVYSYMLLSTLHGVYTRDCSC